MILTLEDIKELISTKYEENLHLEYKRLASLENTTEISKDVSSFANSDGGEIVYGVIEDNNKPVSLDDSIAQANKTKEWLENIITSNINPKIDGVIITPINNPENNNLLFIVRIPKSQRAPHMAKDNRYYKRFNFKAQPMEHYEIEDIRNRLSVPNLDINLTQLINSSFGHADKLTTELNLKIENTTDTLVSYYSIGLAFPHDWDIVLRGYHSTEASTCNVAGKNVNYKVYNFNYAIPHAMPIWKNRPFLILDSACYISIPVAQGITSISTNPIIVNLSYPNAKTKVFNFELFYNFESDSISIVKKVDFQGNLN